MVDFKQSDSLKAKKKAEEAREKFLRFIEAYNKLEDRSPENLDKLAEKMLG